MSTAQKIILLGGILLSACLLYLLSPIITPFLIAGLLAYMGDPLIRRLQILKLPRSVAVTMVFIIVMAIFLGLLFLLIPFLGMELQLLIVKSPDILNWIQATILPWIKTYGGVSLTLDVTAIKTMLASHWKEAGNLALIVWQTLTHSGSVLMAGALYIMLIPVVTFYLLRDWSGVLQGAKQLLPRKIKKPVCEFSQECNEVLGAFFRGQLWVMLLLSVFYSVGLSWIGIQLALLIGILAGVMSIVPYLGSIIGILTAVIAAAIQFHDSTSMIYVLILFAVGHVLEGMVLTPWFVGDRIGLHPVWVIFAILAGGHLFGFFGVLLALPIAAVLMVMLRFMRQHYARA